MKPTFQINRQSRRAEAQRPSGHSVNAMPSIEWSFQSGADLRAGTVQTADSVPSVRRGIYAATHGLYDAGSKWEDRIEAIGLGVVVALASWPIMQAVYTAMHTL